MAGLNSIDDSSWPEVENINSYAVLIGYLQMGVRVLGLLMVAWGTAVLLGGLVDKLETKDFWCLAAITIIQTLGVFDFVLKEKTRAVWDSIRGLQAVVKATFSCFEKIKATFLRRSRSSAKKKERRARWMTCCCYVLCCVPVNTLIGALSFAVLFYVGLYISLGFSWWRVSRVDGDYGSAAADKKDVKEQLTPPALRVLYFMGLVQGSFLLFRVALDWGLRVVAVIFRTGLAWDVARDYRLDLDARIVSKYLRETVTGCKKHPFFAKGRNLVTYGVDLLLMEPTPTSTSSSSSSRSRSCSSKRYLSGLAILGTILQRDDDDTDTTHGQPTMMKHLLTSSASFGQVIHRLLETLGPASPYSGAVKVCAARILEEVAGSVRLEEFAGATKCIASLLCTFEEHCWRPEGYERDRGLPSEYERDWLLKEQERRYILEVVRRSRTPPSPSLLRRLLKPLQFHHRTAANGDGSVAPPPPPSPGSDEDGGKTRGLIVRGYAWLVISGLRVLQALAASEDNCEFISSSTQAEVSRTMRPLASDGLHRDHHDEWCMIAEESLKLLTLLTAAPGETGTALRVQIAGDTVGAVAALEIVLGCPRCPVVRKRQAAEVLLGLDLPPPVDTSSIVVVPGGSGSTSSSSAAVFMGILLHILLLPDKHFGGMFGPTHVLKKRSCTRRLAGEKLVAMVSALQQPSGGDDDDGGAASATATSMLQQAAGVALGNLTSTVVGAGNDASWRIHAARILEDLCQDYTKDDEYLKEIKKAMCTAMPQVIKQLLDGSGSTTQAVTVTEAKKIVHCQAPAAGTDLEQGAVSDDTIGEETAASRHHRQQAKDDDEQPEGIMQLYQALVSLCHGIPNSWMETDKDLASELDGIAAEVCNVEGMPFSAFISLRAELKRRYCWEEKNARVRAN